MAAIGALVAVAGATLLIAEHSSSDSTIRDPSTATSVVEGTSSTLAPTKPQQDPSVVRANELGVIPVLMYHRIVDRPTSKLDRTPEQLRAELERLAASDFVPVTAAQYVNGEIDIPAGKHPVVLTFDDGSPTHLTLGADGLPIPTCAVGVILDVAKRYPGFRATATFYANRRPFDDSTGTAARWAVSHGFELGNHTFSHPRLSRLSDTRVQREIVLLQQLIAGLAPAAKLETIALPYGIRPHTERLLMAGAWNNHSYRFNGAFLVGANPSPSPFTTSFNSLRIPRIRSDVDGVAFGSGDWLNRLAKTPDTLYTSDGDPRFISYPASMDAKLRPEFRAKAYAYPDPAPASTTTAPTTIAPTTTLDQAAPGVVPTSQTEASTVSPTTTDASAASETLASE